MTTSRENLMLDEDLAGVRLEEHEHEKGVVVLIPAGEVIRIDPTAPRLGRMQKVEWQGSAYGVFPQDLLKRCGSIAFRS
jgi:putative hemolysin